MSIETLNISKRFGYENLGIQQVLGVKFLISELGKMPLLDTIARLSSINLLISNERHDAGTESRLRSVHLNPALQDRILKFEQQSGVGIVFNRQAALLLIHFSRHYCDPCVDVKNYRHIDLNLGLFFLIVLFFLGWEFFNKFSVSGFVVST